jgi:hypothetical protein
MSDVLDQLRDACAVVAQRARHVSIVREAIAPYSASLPIAAAPIPDRKAHLVSGTREELAAFWLTLDAINFGSGWFPTLRKRPGRSGYFTIAGGVRRRFREHGPWRAEALASMTAQEIAQALRQHPQHELMGLFATSLRDLGEHVASEYGGRFAAVTERAGASAVELVTVLSGWQCFDDVSVYQELRVPFLKRAQIAAADLSLARVSDFDDSERLTLFADNLVPHVLRLDGILRFESHLVERIERGELLEHGSTEEVELRACAVHAVELLSASTQRPAAELDRVLWQRGQQPRYKARPRPRSRSTAY